MAAAKKKKPIKTGASSGHITNLKQSILETFDIHGLLIVPTPSKQARLKNSAFKLLKPRVHNGKNLTKLVSFKTQKKYFAFLKPANLAQFWAQCKHSFSGVSNCHSPLSSIYISDVRCKTARETVKTATVAALVLAVQKGLAHGRA